MTQREEDLLADSIQQHDQKQKKLAEDTFWDLISIVLRWRTFIIVTTGVVAIASIIFSLMLPKWYRSEARLLAPASSGTSPISAALMADISSAASALLGGGFGGDFDRYLSILTSRSVSVSIIEQFNLIEVYELEDTETPLQSTIELLAENSEFMIDREYGFFEIQVYDQDPQRAADMTNAFVTELNRVNLELSTQDAANYRRFVEKRYLESLAIRDSLETAIQSFQEEYQVYDLPSQANSFFEQMAQMRVDEITLEIQYQALLSQYGSANPQVQSARSAFNAATRKRMEAFEGNEAILPIPKENVPTVMRKYLELEQEMLIQKNILELVAPLYEQARFQEEREFQALQVVDKAVPALKKAKPKRSTIVIMATMAAFVLSLLYVFVYTWWKIITSVTRTDCSKPSSAPLPTLSNELFRCIAWSKPVARAVLELGLIGINMGFGLALLFILYATFFNTKLLLAIPALGIGMSIFYLVLRYEVPALCFTIVGFSAVLRSSDDVNIAEILYYLYYVCYIGSWFFSRLILRRELIFRDLVDWILLGFVGYVTGTLFISVLQGGNMSMGIREWLPQIVLILYFPIKEACYKHKYAPHYLFGAFLVLCTIVTVLNYAEYYYDLSAATQLWQIFNERVRDNERLLMVQALALLVLFLFIDKRSHKLLILFGLFIFVSGIIIGQSRALWVSFFLGTSVIFALISPAMRIQALVVAGTSIVLAFVAGAVLLSDFFGFIFEALINRVASLQSATTQDVSLVNRFSEWTAAWEKIVRNPLLGHGFGVNFHFYDLTREATMVKSHIHNTYLGAWYRHGLVGLTLFLLYQARSAWLSLRLYQTRPNPGVPQLAGLISLGCIVALALAASTESLLIVDEGTLTYAITTGIAVRTLATRTVVANVAEPETYLRG